MAPAPTEAQEGRRTFQGNISEIIRSQCTDHAILSTLNASLQTSIPPASHSTSQTSSEILVEVLVPMLAISIFGILWIMRRRVAGMFNCYSRKRYFFRRYGKLDDIESTQIRASWRISSTDTLVSRPFRFTMTKDETRRDEAHLQAMKPRHQQGLRYYKYMYPQKAQKRK